MTSFTCPRCDMTSHNPTDLMEGYCGNCHDYTGPDNPMDDDPRVRFGHDMYFDRNGVPITLRQFAELTDGGGPVGRLKYKRVGHDEIGPYRISTVWVGINMSFHGFDGVPPLIFETMVFTTDGPADWGRQRYATEEQALAGHEEMCAETRMKLAGDSLDRPLEEKAAHDHD
jgi:hypothetical protein